MEQQGTCPRLRLAIALAVALIAAPSLAQQFPTRTMRIVVGFAPGGSADVLSRIMGQRLAESFGQPVIIENRPAAGGTVATDIVAKAQPDGHTILLGSVGTMVFAPALYTKLPYDVHARLRARRPVGDVPARARRARVLARDECQSARRSGAREAGNAALRLAGHRRFGAHLRRDDEPHGAHQGRARALQRRRAGVDRRARRRSRLRDDGGRDRADAGRERQDQSAGRDEREAERHAAGRAADRERGAGYEALNWHGIEVPAKTPKAIVARLYEESAKILRRPDMQEKLHALSMDVDSRPPDEYREFIRAEIARWVPIIKASGARVE